MILAIVLWCVSILHYVWKNLVQGYDKLAASWSFWKDQLEYKQHVTRRMMKPHQTTFSKLFFDYLARQGIWWKFRENSTEKSMEYQNIWISSRISPYFQDSPPMIHMDSPEIRLRVPCKVPSSPINRLHQNTSKKHTQNPRGQFSACHLWRRPSITTMKWWILLSRNWPLLSLRH